MTKTNDLLVKVSKRTKDGVESWEGTATLPGFAPTKLTKLKTNDSRFRTRSSLTDAARRIANRYGFTEVKFEGVGCDTTKKTTKSKNKSTENVEVNA